MKEWRAWEYLVMRTIISLERVTKDSEMKWVITKGNENLSIIPLSFLGDIRRPLWVADRGSELLRSDPTGSVRTEGRNEKTSPADSY